jgi:GMP synthase-like glutamine amidotransferase
VKNILEPGEPGGAESGIDADEYCLRERKMRVLILMHDAREDAGTIMDFLEQNQSDIRIVKFYEGEPLPADALQYKAVVSMGGPMNVYEETEYPFLKAETMFLARCFERNIPVLGICLGAQLMAKAAGAPLVGSRAMVGDQPPRRGKLRNQVNAANRASGRVLG